MAMCEVPHSPIEEYREDILTARRVCCRLPDGTIRSNQNHRILGTVCLSLPIRVFWVADPTSVNEKLVLVASRLQLRRDRPFTVGFLHGRSCGIPIIEIPYETYYGRVGRIQKKVDVADLMRCCVGCI